MIRALVPRRWVSDPHGLAARSNSIRCASTPSSLFSCHLPLRAAKWVKKQTVHTHVNGGGQCRTDHADQASDANACNETALPASLQVRHHLLVLVARAAPSPDAVAPDVPPLLVAVGAPRDQQEPRRPLEASKSIQMWKVGTGHMSLHRLLISHSPRGSRRAPGDLLPSLSTLSGHVFGVVGCLQPPLHHLYHWSTPRHQSHSGPAVDINATRQGGTYNLQV